MLPHLAVLDQNTSNYGPNVKIGPKLWDLGFHIEIKREILKIFLFQTVKAYNFHIRHAASSNGPLLKYFKLWPWCENWPYIVGPRIS